MCCSTYFSFCMKYKPAVHALIISPLFLLKMCMVNNFHIIFYEITLFIRKLRAKFLIYHFNPYEFSLFKTPISAKKIQKQVILSYRNALFSPSTQIKEIPYKNS